MQSCRIHENYGKIKREVEALLKTELQKIKEWDGGDKVAKKRKSKGTEGDSLPPEKWIRKKDVKALSR